MKQRRIHLYTDAGMERTINPDIVTLGFKAVDDNGVDTIISGVRYWTRRMGLMDVDHPMSPKAPLGERKMSSTVAEMRAVVLGLQVMRSLSWQEHTKCDAVTVYCDNLNACNVLRWGIDLLKRGGVEDAGDAAKWEQARVWCPRYVLDEMFVLLGKHAAKGMWITTSGEMWYLYRDIEVVHLSGHPTKPELESGKSKEGRPVSIHNHHVDKQCEYWANAIKGDAAKRERVVTLNPGHGYQQQVCANTPFSKFILDYDTIPCCYDTDSTWYSSLHREITAFAEWDIESEELLKHHFGSVNLEKPRRSRKKSAESEATS